MKQSTQCSVLSLLRPRLRLLGTEEFLISLILFFQEGNVSKMQLCFNSYLFGLTSLLEMNAFVATFHQPSFSEQGCSQKFLSKTVK